MSIRVNQVTKVYGEQKALNGVSLEIEKGEIVGLLGPNGAGKSTLMKILTCYIPPTSGQAFVNDMNCADESLAVRSIIGYLPENNPLYYDMYVREFLTFIAGIHNLKDKKSRVDEMIEITGLKPEMHKRIGALSKGYKQRVGLAQALIHNPEVLIMDEPTSGLDPNQIVEIRELIKKLGSEKTILLSTHIMQEVEAICNRVVIIDKGKIVADGKTADLASMFSAAEMLMVEFDRKVSREAILAVKGVKDATTKGNNVWEIETDNDIDVRKEIFDFAVRNQYKVLSLNKEKHSIEELFQQLTK
ncbi:MAG: gliding motility-associated ABC transporter ATP-binding subunit GldA [Bacteroidetes bacterium GWF2_43_63]|nr:MAG: gliding motility-associated ABC transporter ATP-binding subunit GldA [Bacteroidetes bacterium GWE2_42_42]OFY56073.1 MAG: gliding motility-associated ABC transporter ATP-binding subunit GldA [Bacteroidetes bacterium GWF2_43_63]HBG70674.1 gliding motility-associated ABC transporter ATP-binding subunit GldA [Bacteroidales bacterium]HCB62498.1 gliding motility-associated ABC transporter ATP-binding subunit GldA [Bacteroidales bacterium]HCY21953.1 gliding motility-associated ABC transporter 